MTNSKTFLPFLRVYFKQYFSIKADPEEKKKQLLIYGVCALAFLPLVGLICAFVYQFTKVMIQLGKFEVLIGLIFTIGVVMILLFSAVSYLSIMFYSKDNELVASLPIPSRTIFGVKMLTVYMSELLIAAVVYLPTLITAGIAASTLTKLSAGYFIAVPISVLLLPVIPIAIISILSTPLMYIVSFFKRNSFFAATMMIVAFLGIMVAYFVFLQSVMKFTTSKPGDDIVTISENLIKALEIVVKVFYPCYLFASLMAGAGNIAFNLGIFTLIWCGLIVISFVIAVMTYRGSVSRLSVTATKSGKLIKDTKQLKVLPALIKREIKTLTRNPALAFQSFMGCIMTPLMLVIFSSGLFGSGNTGTASSDGVNAAMTSEVTTMGFAVLFSAMMLCSLNYVALIGISRESESFSILKTLPVSPVAVIKSKLYFANIITTIGAVLCVIVLLAVAKINVLNAIAYFVLTIFYGCAMNSFGLTQDLKNPRLKWVSIKEISNRNINAMLPTLVSFGVGMVIMVVSIVAGIMLKNMVWLAFLLIWVLYFLAGLVMYLLFTRKLYDRASEYFERIEV